MKGKVRIKQYWNECLMLFLINILGMLFFLLYKGVHITNLVYTVEFGCVILEILGRYNKGRILIFIELFLFSYKEIFLIAVLGEQCYAKFNTLIGYAICEFISFCPLIVKAEIIYGCIVMVAIIVIFLVGENVLVWYLYKKEEEKGKRKQREINYYLSKLELTEKDSVDMHRVRHDLINYLICLKECVNRNDMGGLEQLVNTMLDETVYKRESFIRFSGNTLIDGLLSYEHDKAKKEKIDIKIKLEIPKDFEVYGVDLCVILTNALDNAIEATKKVGDVNKRWITMSVLYKHKSLFIQVENPYVGELKVDKYGMLITSKGDSLNHGIGLTSIKRATAKYNGIVTTKSKGNIFQLLVLLYL